MATRTKKILVGCAIGCGGLILVVVIGFFSFAAWLSRPGEPLQPGLLLGADTTGYAEWTLSLEDPGTEEFVEGILQRQEELQGEMPDLLPPAVQGMMENWNNRRNRENMRQLFPMVAAWTLRPGDGPGEGRHLLGLSVRALGNQLVFADWLLALLGGRDPDFQTIPHLDEVIYRFGRDTEVSLFLRGNHIFFCYDLDTALQAVERLQPDTGAERRPGPLDALFAELPADRPLRAAVTNENGEILRLWSRIALPPEDRDRLEESASRLRGAVLSGGLRGGEVIEGRLSLKTADPGFAEEYAGEALADFRSGLAYEGLTLDAEVETEGRWIHIPFGAEGLLDVLGTLLNVNVRPGGVIVIEDGDGEGPAPVE